jgi:hypothetical protein
MSIASALSGRAHTLAHARKKGVGAPHLRITLALPDEAESGGVSEKGSNVKRDGTEGAR